MKYTQPHMQSPKSPESRPNVLPSISRRVKAVYMAELLAKAATQNIYEKAANDARKSKEKSITNFPMSDTIKISPTVSPEAATDPLQFKVPDQDSQQIVVNGEVIDMDQHRRAKEAREQIDGIAV